MVTKHLGCSFGLIPHNEDFSAYFYCVVPNEEVSYLENKLIKFLRENYKNYESGENIRNFENIIKYYIFDSSENIMISPDIKEHLQKIVLEQFHGLSQYQLLKTANQLLTEVKGIHNEEKRAIAYGLLDKVELF